MWIWTLLLACGGPASTPNDTTPSAGNTGTDTGSAGPETGLVPSEAMTIPNGGCGLEGYDWLPGDGLGTVVSVEEATDLTMAATTIQTTLAIVGIPPERFDIVYDVRTWRVRYTTQDRGAPVEATMLVSFPEGAGDVPTFAWLHGTTGYNDSCAPSAMGLEGGAFNLLFASLGYAVVSPDYLGLAGLGAASGQLHPYVIAEPTAVVSLDAIRALWAFQQGEASLTSQGTHETVLFGASEGGFAALWSDRYQPHYLPEAEVLGVVAAVPPADLVGLNQHAVSVWGDTTAGLAAAVTTWHDWYRMDTPLSEVLQPSLAAELPEALAAECSPSYVLDGLDSVDDVFTSAFIEAVLRDDASTLPDMMCVGATNSLLTSVVPYESTAPVLYVVAELDELVAAEPTRAAFGPLCDAGYQMEYIECAGADHVEGAVWSLGQQLDWARDRVDGLALGAPCVQGPPQTCDLEKLLR